KGDIVAVVWLNVDGIEMNRATGQRLSIMREHRKDMSMQVNGMHQVALVVQMQPDQLAFFDHDHTSMGKDLAIESEHHARAAKRVAQMVVERDTICRIEMTVDVDGIRLRHAIGRQVEPLRIDSGQHCRGSPFTNDNVRRSGVMLVVGRGYQGNWALR